MVQARINKLAKASLPDVLARAKLPDPALAAVGAALDAAEAVEALISAEFFMEAARVYAFALPKREAVWWACMCTAYTAPPDLTGPDLAARLAAEEWVRTQSDETRREAMAAAKAAGMQGPDAWAGVAAFWSGDSLNPVNVTKNPPPPHLTGVAVVAAITLSSVRLTPRRTAQRIARFLESAKDIATGGPGRLAAEAALTAAEAA